MTNVVSNLAACVARKTGGMTLIDKKSFTVMLGNGVRVRYDAKNFFRAGTSRVQAERYIEPKPAYNVTMLHQTENRAAVGMGSLELPFCEYEILLPAGTRSCDLLTRAVKKAADKVDTCVRAFTEPSGFASRRERRHLP